MVDYSVNLNQTQDNAVTAQRKTYNQNNLQNVKKTNEEYLQFLMDGQTNQWINEKHQADVNEMVKSAIASMHAGDTSELEALVAKCKNDRG